MAIGLQPAKGGNEDGPDRRMSAANGNGSRWMPLGEPAVIAVPLAEPDRVPTSVAARRAVRPMAFDAPVPVGRFYSGRAERRGQGKHWILASRRREKPPMPASAAREPGATAPPHHEHTSSQARGPGLETLDGFLRAIPKYSYPRTSVRGSIKTEGSKTRRGEQNQQQRCEKNGVNRPAPLHRKTSRTTR